MTLFLSIQQVAQRFELSIDTLRYYERIGLIAAVSRDPGGRRRYNEADLRWLEFLKRLRATGMPIADMLRYASLRQEGEATFAARRELLEHHAAEVQARIESLQANLNLLNYKIGWYRTQEQDMASQTSTEPDHVTRNPESSSHNALGALHPRSRPPA